MDDGFRRNNITRGRGEVILRRLYPKDEIILVGDCIQRPVDYSVRRPARHVGVNTLESPGMRFDGLESIL